MGNAAEGQGSALCTFQRVPGRPQPKAIFVLGFHLLGVSLPALQVNLRNHLAHRLWPGNAITMHMVSNSTFLGRRALLWVLTLLMCTGPITIVLRALPGGGSMWFGCDLSLWRADDIRSLEGPHLQALVAAEVNPGPLFQVVLDKIQESCQVTRANLETSCGADCCDLPRDSPAHVRFPLFQGIELDRGEDATVQEHSPLSGQRRLTCL